MNKLNNNTRNNGNCCTLEAQRRTELSVGWNISLHCTKPEKISQTIFFLRFVLKASLCYAYVLYFHIIVESGVAKEDDRFTINGLWCHKDGMCMSDSNGSALSVVYSIAKYPVLCLRLLCIMHWLTWSEYLPIWAIWSLCMWSRSYLKWTLTSMHVRIVCEIRKYNVCWFHFGSIFIVIACVVKFIGIFGVQRIIKFRQKHPLKISYLGSARSVDSPTSGWIVVSPSDPNTASNIASIEASLMLGIG